MALARLGLEPCWAGSHSLVIRLRKYALIGITKERSDKTRKHQTSSMFLARLNVFNRGRELIPALFEPNMFKYVGGQVLRFTHGFLLALHSLLHFFSFLIVTS
eukprot:GHVN01067660.1.p1 GENE.GHVN01067660.1~~GHVN01067660.1.p1  ORF type:complete len:103 (+),score=2.69 GHVN01067660.1:241-549(+)